MGVDSRATRDDSLCWLLWDEAAYGGWVGVVQGERHRRAKALYYV